MKSKVSSLKLPIPDEWLEGVDEVEIRREKDAIIIIPICKIRVKEIHHWYLNF
jgi:virulence-associated protein VagC